MSNTKHTPGPWTFYKKYQGENTVTIKSLTDFEISICDMIGENDETGDTKEKVVSNAKLIAAAPDMFEALNDIEERLRRGYEIPLWLVRKIQSAIKKATT